MSELHLGVDIGGTFTDIVLINENEGTIFTKKVLSTPDDVSEGVVRGIENLLDMLPSTAKAIDFFVHGSTVALNALLERKGCKTALLTTKGFEDVLELGRQTRIDMFDPFVERPQVLIPRHLRKGIQERVSAYGEVIEPLNVTQATQELRGLQEEGIEAVAVCFLHSYVMPRHEQIIKDLIQKHLPGVFTAISSEICPEFREYERISTTAITAYLGPILRQALDQLCRRARRIGLIEPKIMQSNIGISPIKMIEQEPGKTLLSGPCGGVAGSIYFSEIAGYSNLITFDMGGTSTDVCLINNGEPTITTECEIDHLPVKYPMIDIATIGAGGGSIASVDEIGNLSVGPRSAGSVPGPVCYGQGGVKPTITDAHLVLGRLGQESIFSEAGLDIEKASQAIEKRIATPLCMNLEEAAAGMIRIANSNMEKAIRLVSIAKGYDLKDFTLVAFGGAGPMHAAELAMDLDIPRVLIPPFAGVYSALGLLTVDLKTDFTKFFKMVISDSSHVLLDKILDGFADLMPRAEEWFREAQVPPRDRRIRRSIDMRYHHQNYEIRVSIQDRNQTIEQLVDAFHRRHKIRYGHAMVGEPVEIVNLRLEAIGQLPRPQLKELPVSGGDASKAIRTQRKIWFLGDGMLRKCPVYDWGLLFPGAKLAGPAVIEQPKATIVIPPSSRAQVDRFNNLLVTIKEQIDNDN